MSERIITRSDVKSAIPKTTPTIALFIPFIGSVLVKGFLTVVRTDEVGHLLDEYS